VNYEYQIMTFEWTNAQYVAFLNAIDLQGTNPNSAGLTSRGRPANVTGGKATGILKEVCGGLSREEP
jgi:hypothetical protein